MANQIAVWLDRNGARGDVVHRRRRRWRDAL
jgi:hypothetical protein